MYKNLCFYIHIFIYINAHVIHILIYIKYVLPVLGFLLASGSGFTTMSPLPFAILTFVPSSKNRRVILVGFLDKHKYLCYYILIYLCIDAILYIFICICLYSHIYIYYIYVLSSKNRRNICRSPTYIHIYLYVYM
jgi:hypothetical protein